MRTLQMPEVCKSETLTQQLAMSLVQFVSFSLTQSEQCSLVAAGLFSLNQHLK